MFAINVSEFFCLCASAAVVFISIYAQTAVDPCRLITPCAGVPDLALHLQLLPVEPPATACFRCPLTEPKGLSMCRAWLTSEFSAHCIPSLTRLGAVILGSSKTPVGATCHCASVQGPSTKSRHGLQVTRHHAAAGVSQPCENRFFAMRLSTPGS